jgi:hypothetical protein
MFLNNTDEDNDDDSLITTSPTTMTNSDSSDSAIVSDEIDDKQSIFRNSWPIMMEKPDLTTKFTSLSQSFNILNQLKQQTIYENTCKDNQDKYKRPLPWLNSTSITHQYPSPPLEITSNKVFK